MISFKPIEFDRNEKSKYNYYIFYSVKNKRNVQVYSQQAYYHCLDLEMNYNIESYCENPEQLNIERNEQVFSRNIDFIVRRNNNKRYILQRLLPYYHNNITHKFKNMCISEESWCKEYNYDYQVITLDVKHRNNYYLHNIKLLYGLIKHTNEPLYNRSLEDITFILHHSKNNTINTLMNKLNLSMNDVLKSFAIGVARGIILHPIDNSAITINTEVNLLLNEKSN